MGQSIVNERRVSAEHEAGHIVVGWAYGLPIRHASAGERHGSVLLSRFYSWTSMFREVNQQTVKRDIIYLLGGRIASTLAGFDDPEEIWHEDVYLSRFLARRYALDLAVVRCEAEQIILRNKQAISSVAAQLYEKGKLDWYDLTILQMELLAQGRLKLVHHKIH